MGVEDELKRVASDDLAIPEVTKEESVRREARAMVDRAVDVSKERQVPIVKAIEVWTERVAELRNEAKPALVRKSEDLLEEHNDQYRVISLIKAQRVLKNLKLALEYAEGKSI